MRTDFEFSAEDGTILRGWMFTPADTTAPSPAIVMSHGFAGVKELLEHTAEAFCAAGFVVVLYDHRCWGSSDGLPRHETDPVAQARDMRTAISAVESLACVDPDRIGLWGTSYAGAHVLQTAALDRRVRCVVAQVPMISGYRTFQTLLPADGMAALRQQLDNDRRARFAGHAPSVIPVSSKDGTQPHALPGERTHWYLHHSPGTGSSPDWSDEITLRSLDWALEYDVTPFVERISPTPLLMVVASHDTLTPTHLALDAFERARQPKQLQILPGDHYAPYHDQFTLASATTIAFFHEHLGTR